MTDTGFSRDCAAIETTEDAFLDGRLILRQPTKGARASIDALFLAAAITSKSEVPERLLEAGTGSGIVSLAVANRSPLAQIIAVDIEPIMCALASDNIQRNGFANRIKVFNGDVTSPLSHNTSLLSLSGTFDHVFANPPFHSESQSRASPDNLKTRAHRARPGALEDWIRFFTAMAKPHGAMTLIHAPSELTQILSCLSGRFGGLTLFPLFPRAGTPAKRIIISGVKGSKAPHRLLPGMTLHKDDGAFTAEAEAVLRGATSLNLENATPCP